METARDNAEWSDLEIQAAVAAYLDMLQREINGQKINNSYENRVLRGGPLAGRTKGSVEFRMQNISTVLVGMNQERIKGYKPARNVGANVVRSIQKALNAQRTAPIPDDFEPTADDTILGRRAAILQKYQFTAPPPGIVPPKQSASARTAYSRDPAVAAWVRQQAKGFCEGCSQTAPFEIDGQPFLEIHHVKHLAQLGSDRPSNTVALCPNCHRRCHHSSDKEAFTASLYDKVKRLVEED